MIEALKRWLHARSRRERVLLGIAAALSFAVAAIYGVALPLASARESAWIEYRGALERRATPGPAQPSSGVSLDPARLSALVQSSADERGFALSRVTPENRGRLSLSIAQARAGPVTDWLRTLEEKGVIVEQVRLSPRGDGTVSAEMMLAATSR